MIKDTVKLSDDFKAQTTKAIASVVLFALLYLFMVVLAIGFSILCGFIGVALIVLKPNFITLGLGIGLASLGVIVLIFLIKFMFKSNKADRSQLLEITAAQEPALFQLIEEIVSQVGCQFPKKIYLSADVNAAVFYDSSFWSMFFPVKKNLQIGLGLVNTVTSEELKAILAHEFGHFSQRTMKVGSYVYHVNQIIHNLLFDNESYDARIQKWASLSGYFSFFVAIAVRIVQGIQWLLSKGYAFVNVNYMALSREMEFHADEVAAHLTGYQPLKNALLRMELADYSFSSVLNHYESRVRDNIKSENVYKEQLHVMKFLAQDNEVAFINGLPQPTLEELNKYNKSKLIIKDQWASHPATEERISRLEQLNLLPDHQDAYPANKLLKNSELTQQMLTDQLFREVSYSGEVRVSAPDEFVAAFEKGMRENSFGKVYNGYYDNKNPLPFDLAEMANESNTALAASALFSPEKVELVYSSIALQNDIQLLTQIANKELVLKTFDYDGKRFKQKDARTLLLSLKKEQELLEEHIRMHDRNIFLCLQEKEKSLKKEPGLASIYQEFFTFDHYYDQKLAIYMQMLEATQFIHKITPIKEIKTNFLKLQPLEQTLKESIRELLADEMFEQEITEEVKETFDQYLSKDWPYFEQDQYFDDQLELLFSVMGTFYYVLSDRYFRFKKQLLVYQEELLLTSEQQAGGFNLEVESVS